MWMKRCLLAIALIAYSAPVTASVSRWTPGQLASLRHWIAAAPQDALPLLDSKSLDRATANSDTAATDKAANDLALGLARLHLLGCATAAQRNGWTIADTDTSLDLSAMLTRALASNSLDAFFAGLRPRHPDYAVLRAAYENEGDQTRKLTLARNLERWRWMPRSLGPDNVLVNAAAFEVQLWRNATKVGIWPVIVGKQATPTPVFAATITGVTLNPWWFVPQSIVRESVGSFVRRNPSLARKRGYVWAGGSYRQRPGPGNALGSMKLAMANPFNVYMHDTPSKNLFERQTRAFSHGCIRTGNALGFAATLLTGVMTREQIDLIVATRTTTDVALASSLPVYVTYFTATAGADGSVAYHPDIYGRDAQVGFMSNPSRACGA
ncbi:L,D-transpeptidase family protein [Novosphingobium sp.]|uniref:L,D-transpeptidase family protein n=1 Tax=Novosphingobium sp. TaxID=1874826 RepID=UPI0025FD26DE|nr:L,D-transpeptidase family protein [Novosphingobium sp.]